MRQISVLFFFAYLGHEIVLFIFFISGIALLYFFSENGERSLKKKKKKKKKKVQLYRSSMRVWT